MTHHHLLDCRRAILLAAALCLCAPSSAHKPSPSSGNIAVDYVPSDVHLSHDDAMKIIEEQVRYESKRGMWPANFGGGSICTNQECKRLISNKGALNVLPRRFSVACMDGTTISIPISAVHIEVSYRNLRNSKAAVVRLNRQVSLNFGFGGTDGSLKEIADALFVLSSEGKAESMGPDDAEFERVATNYRQLEQKPLLPEAAHRFAVQAEGAINDKDFDSAADLYEQALVVAPWWPEGHFNRAIVLSGTGDFSEAIIEMKRFLTLVPDAPNARAAQDKIYDWERKSGEQNGPAQ